MPDPRLCLPCAVALAAALAAPHAGAAVFKCLLEDGKVFYQDAPCAPGRELRDFDKDPANVSVVPFDQPASGSRASGKGASAPKAPQSRAAAAGARREATPRVPRPEAKPARKSAERGDPGQRKFLRPGMSEGEVIARVGPPDMTSSGTRKGARWTYMPVPEDARTITNLQFDNGRLVEIERKVLR